MCVHVHALSFSPPLGGGGGGGGGGEQTIMRVLYSTSGVNWAVYSQFILKAWSSGGVC